MAEEEKKGGCGGCTGGSCPGGGGCENEDKEPNCGKPGCDGTSKKDGTGGRCGGGNCSGCGQD